MNEEQRAAFLIAQSAAAMIEALGMVAANAQSASDRQFAKHEFDALIDRYGLGHNAAVTWLHGQ